MCPASPGEVRTALVLMPFDSSLDDIYLFGIKEALEHRGYRCTRLDEESYSGHVIDEIQSRILTCDVVVAEITSGNPNVYYEVGYAHGAGKHPILVAEETRELPFDLQGYKLIVYHGEIRTLRAELDKHVEWLEESNAAIRRMAGDPRRLRQQSQAVLVHLYQAGEERPAAECAEIAAGLFAVMKDLRFLGYVAYRGQLLPATPVQLTEAGRQAARQLLDASDEAP